MYNANQPCPSNRQRLVRAVAVRRIARVLALAEISVARRFGRESLRREARTSMGSIAERLRG